MKVLVLNGINLQNIGNREPNIYGRENFDNYIKKLQEEYEIDYFQSNIEDKIIEKIYEAENKYKGIVLNAGAYSHSSVAIRDCISNIKIPVILIHISNVHKREIFRQVEIIAPVCSGIISGFGLLSYRLGIEAIIRITEK
jgi:3-dehydroquinate dehydratase II